jgi:hypothetical protein
MKATFVRAAIACAALGFCAPSFAQSSSDRPADAATPPSAPASAPTPSGSPEKGSSSGGASADQNRRSNTFTHGESKRCESLSGAQKDQCDKEEATKTEGPAAQEASKPDRLKD